MIASGKGSVCRVTTRLCQVPPCEIATGDGRRRYANSVAFERITTNPDVMGGLPCIRGMRMPVATVVGMVADGMSVAEILDDFPDLEAEDIAAALRSVPSTRV